MYIVKSSVEVYFSENFIRTGNMIVVAVGLGLTGLFALMEFGGLFRILGILLSLIAVLLNIPQVNGGGDSLLLI